ncbi:MAG: serine/threonine-protein kinase, partial [Kofleriaceae bacterium]
MECLDDSTVHAWVRGSLATDGEVVRDHLDQCESCRDLVTTVVDSQWIGHHVGRYRIDELIGGGAMGEVFRAHDPDLGRDVAIKLVRSGGSERRLLREAQAMARLAHPSVIRVYDVGTVADKVFLAMELVAGTTLATWFEGDRGWRAVTAVMRDVGRGLAAAHERGLVHGDVKPENVLIADDGRVVVTDFGLARSGTPEPAGELGPEPALDRTATRGLAGTPAYMAPEQLVDGATATPASDQFSYCVTLFEGLYGRRPFAGNDLRELRDALVEGKLVVPARPKVPARIVRVLRRGLATDPQARFPSLAALVAELDAASRRRSLAIAIAVPAVALAVVATAWGMSSHASPCSDGDRQLAGVWDDAVRARVRGAFDAAHLPYAAVSFATVSSALDHHRGQWLDAYTETCTATRVHETQSGALLDIRMQCLRDRKHEVGALVDALVAGGAPAVRDSVAAANALSPVTDCSDLASLEEVERMPTDPARRAQIAAVATELAGCKAQLQTGDYRGSARCALAAVAGANATGYGPTIADAELAAGMSGVRLRTFDQANAAFTHALLAAEGSRDARARAEALIWLVAVAAELAAFAEGHQRVDHAAA